MRRYWWDGTLQLEQEVEIHGELFHHICEVCRLPEGAKFELLTTDQKAMLVILSKKNKKNAQIKVLNERTLAPLPRPYINLCLSLPKFNTLEAVLEKSVELGVYKVQPFFSDYSFVRTAEKISDSRFKRWQKIVMNASQQTGRSPLMEIGKPVKLVDLLKSYKESKDVSGIFPYEGQGQLDLYENLKSFKNKDCQEVWLFVGSEGGFSDKEVELFKSFELSPMSLGQQVLRVETACVAITSAIKYELRLF